MEIAHVSIYRPFHGKYGLLYLHAGDHIPESRSIHWIQSILDLLL